jgi:hypothetical protein
MNQIEARYDVLDNGVKFLNIYIDGKSLDSIIHDYYPDKTYKGLVPTLLDWLHDAKERQVVWERVFSDSEIPNVVPILMCPDDVDLWCTVIDVEVLKDGNFVKWFRVGIDKSGTDNLPYSIGSDVQWLDKIPTFQFEKTEYLDFVQTFYNLIKIDELKQKIAFWIHRISTQEKIPNTISAFNFRIFEAESEYLIYFHSSESYNLNNDEWTLKLDFIPQEHYLGLGELSKERSSIEIQQIVKEGIEDVIKFQTWPQTFVHRAKLITIGFKGKELLKIVGNR